jgi:SAM-dependent methyltransferase
MTMSATTQSIDPCGPAAGGVTTSPAVAPFDPLTERTRTIWTSGDFEKIAVGYAAGAAAFVERLGIEPGQTVLDAACGTGNLAIPAAQRGARVTGLDIAPNLIEAARRASADAGVDIRFDTGSAEAMPYADESFDVAISMFGVMFAARPEQTLAELVRVTRRGGTIALACWTPGGFVGEMLRAHVAKVPPPAGAQSPLAWGDEDAMRGRLEAHAGRVASVQFIPRTIVMAWPMPPGAVVELFREFYGPSVRTFAALDATGRAALSADLLRLWSGRNRAVEGETFVEAEYLETRISLAK